MSSDTTQALLDRIAQRVRAISGVELLMLFGSRARGDVHGGSDWDFGYLAAPALDVQALSAILVETVASDHVDLVDLRQAGGLLRYRAARDGVALVEGAPGTADRFRFEAARFWFDAAPVLERGYDQVLLALGR
jgi:predicted nucleotidyltransferase